jgi:ATP-dependent RNA helicase RhlE
VEVAPSGTTADRVTQEFFMVRKDEKNRLMEKLLTQYPVTTLIFSRTKFGAKRLARAIRDMGATASELHSDRSLSQRREALDGFKTGKYRVLVATDIAARGIDVTGIGLVLNYDLPMNTSDYVHRIGRTARAGAGGHAISFVAPEQRSEIREIERLIKKTVAISRMPEGLPPARIQERVHFEERPSFGRNRRPGFGSSRPSYGARPSYGGTRSSYGGSPRPAGGSRPSFGSPRPAGFGGARSSGPRPAGQSDGRPSFPRKRFRRG